MKARRILAVAVVCLLALAPAVFPRSECQKVLQPPLNPMAIPGTVQLSSPLVLSFAGDTTWIQVQADDNTCPGDPNLGHGGEATGGPGASQTWCFEGGPGDTCGTNPPWNTKCFTHVDVRSLPSQTGTNFWHIDTYRTNQRTYCGTYALWCGSAALWQGKPVECGTWVNPPGYGKQWNCHVQLTLPAEFAVANGCTLYFDPRYDTECKYDYFYVDYWNGSQWNTLATFNATSNNPGGNCGAPSKPKPDYFGNTDVNRLVNCDWQARTIPAEPAFKAVITHAMLGTVMNAPRFRWRFTSDGGWDDADGSGDTDGGAFLDNVWVKGDAGQFVEDFESGVLNPAYWSLPSPPGILDAWHIAHDTDPPYEGGDGGTRTTCRLDSSFAYRARPEQGYPAGVPWRNGWDYRLMSPRVPMLLTGCLVQYDAFRCAKDVTCDYTAFRVRRHDPVSQAWCPWSSYLPDICGGGCYFWSLDFTENMTHLAQGADSIQYCWEILDTSSPGDICLGHHNGTEFIVDNVSMGFYDDNATVFYARNIDIFQDTFFTGICAFNSFFDAYDPDTIAWYSGPSAHTLPRENQLYIDVGDNDHLASVVLKGSLDHGATWASKPMTMDHASDPRDPGLGGSYYGTLCPADFGLSQWAKGTEVWYYVQATDALGHAAYFPARANPGHPSHSGGVGDYFEFSVLPMFPAEFDGTKILLVDGHNRKLYDWSPCLSTLSETMPLEDIYEQTLTDAGYCYDKYDIQGAGTNEEIHPIWFDDYDAVVWFTGPYFSNYLFWKDAQVALRSYMADGGKVVLCGDRIAFDMARTSEGGNGDDSLGGEFLSGVLGADYLKEMEGGFDKPFVYAGAVASVNVFGVPTAVDLDTMLIYRECPYLKDMSYMQTNPTPPAGYTAQPLLHVLNPGTTVTHADEATYVEYQGVGQCVFVNFDLCASVNHIVGYCDGATPSPAPDFNAGRYSGRVELIRVVLEDLFGLEPTGGGVADIPGPAAPAYQWALAQNQPNPVAGSGTEIRFIVARPGRVNISVYGVSGQVVRCLVDGTKQPGEYVATWDGRNARGESVSSGVYFYKMEASDYKTTKKLLLVH